MEGMVVQEAMAVMLQQEVGHTLAQQEDWEEFLEWVVKPMPEGWWD
jgi:hypothetical protein